MAVFRVEKNKGYTVMSNHHLRNKELTLKAKGLLSQMLSLPENWDYTLAGLSHINKESIDAIRTAVLELEKAGYIKRLRPEGEEERARKPIFLLRGFLCGWKVPLSINNASLLSILSERKYCRKRKISCETAQDNETSCISST